jgi:hypothetical protein
MFPPAPPAPERRAVDAHSDQEAKELHAPDEVPEDQEQDPFAVPLGSEREEEPSLGRARNAATPPARETLPAGGAALYGP